MISRGTCKVKEHSEIKLDMHGDRRQKHSKQHKKPSEHVLELRIGGIFLPRNRPTLGPQVQSQSP